MNLRIRILVFQTLQIKKLLFTTIFAAVSASIFAVPETDSLYCEILISNHIKLSTANRLMFLLDAEGVTDSLIHFGKGTKNRTIRKAVNLHMASYYLDKMSNMTATLQAATRAEKEAREECDTPYIEEALALQAVANHRMGRIDMALEAAQTELRLDSMRRDSANLSRAYNILAGLSLQANRLDDAKHYILKATEIERSLEDSSLLSVRYGMAAEIYTKSKEYDRALDFAQRAYELDRKAGNNIKVARRLSQTADIYAAQHADKEAESFYLRAIDMLRAENEKTSLAITLKQLGRLYMRMGRNNAAKHALTECESVCRATGNNYILQQACRLLADALSDQSPRLALNYMREAMTLNDSLHNERAEKLANEIRLSQRNELAIMDGRRGTADSLRECYPTLLILLAGIACIIFATWFAHRKKPQEIIEETDVAEDETEVVPATEAMEEAESQTLKAKDVEFLARVSELYEQSLERDRLSIDVLAAEMCMSRSQFTRRIMAATNMSANTYFNRLRLEKAARLLKESERPVNTIAYECGFDDTPYFCNLFKKFYKVTPMQYRIIPKTTE